MKRSINRHLKTFATVTLCMVVWTFGMPHAAFSRAIEVPSMTSLLVATTQTINPSAINIGDRIPLLVVSDVKIDGVTVIAVGARAMARITQAKDAGMIGIPAAVGLALESVEAVDGTIIPISGSRIQEGKDKMFLSIGLSLICCLLFALTKGGAAEIPMGSEIMANTTMKVSVAV